MKKIKGRGYLGVKTGNRRIFLDFDRNTLTWLVDTCTHQIYISPLVSKRLENCMRSAKQNGALNLPQVGTSRLASIFGLEFSRYIWSSLVFPGRKRITSCACVQSIQRLVSQSRDLVWNKNGHYGFLSCCPRTLTVSIFKSAYCQIPTSFQKYSRTPRTRFSNSPLT